MKLDVPYFKQDKIYSCGAATLQMVFKYFGVFKSEQEISGKLGISSDKGVNNEQMRKVAQDYGFYCYVNEDAPFEEILEYLNLNLPVIVNFIEPTYNEGHYAVAVGFEDENLILNDPWNGQGFKISRENFEQNWRSEHSRNHRWLLVISTEKIKIGKTFNPVF